ncbi:hypothetical protein IFR05_002969 [Cadophora sp. M221]|nr:hypothetical protein IFR05_002969 [Cadophora sp. M221]
MSYNVYKVRYTLTIPDPSMPSPRYHTVIFVATSKDGSGIVHHVIGDITSGMTYSTRDEGQPETSSTFFSKDFLGAISINDYPHEIDRVLRAQPPPPKQKHFHIDTMRMEQQKPDGTFYQPGEDRPPMIKCTEWIENQAIPALYESGVLRSS